MKYLEPKSPLNTKFYSIDYNSNFGNDLLTSADVIVSAGTVTISKVMFLAATVGFLLAGGEIDEYCELSIVLGTGAGQTLNDQAVINIVEDENNIDFSIVTKQTIVEFAFQDLRLSGYTFDHSAAEVSAMLMRLDALMREYRGRGINTNYNHPPAIGLSNLNDVAGIDDSLTLSIATLVACSYMDGIGKTYTPNLIKKQNDSFNFVYSSCSSIPNRILTANTPMGAGGKLWNIYRPFMLRAPSNTAGAILNSMGAQYIPASTMW